MKQFLLLFIGLSLTLMLLASCSSTPKDQDDQTSYDIKNQAAEYARYGDNFFNQAQYDQALKFFEMALKENISVNNEEGIVKTYNSIGKVYIAQGEYEYARSTFTLAYQLAETLGDNILLSRTENNMGELLLRNGKPAEAIELFVKAVERLEGIEFPKKDKKKKESDQKDHRPVLYHNTGLAYKQQGDLDQAESYLRQALDLNIQDENFKNMADNYYALASVYSKRERYDEARDFASLALENDKTIENSLGIAKDLLALGIISEKAGDLEEALEHYKKSYLVFRTLNLVTDAKKVLQPVIKLLEETGATEEADNYREIMDSLGT